MHALMLDQKGKGQRLLDTVSPIRRRAGKVRDMDVLTASAATLTRDGEEQCLTQLLEHLGAERLRLVRKLHGEVAERQKEVRRRLKQYSTLTAKSAVVSKKGSPKVYEWPADATATALQLLNELTAWPRLTRSNLHPYRLKIKELRYILQLGDEADTGFVDALGEVKGSIGEWHDWTELSSIASEILDHGSHCALLKEIRSNTTDKFNDALSLAEAMRRKYLRSAPASKGRSTKLKEPVLITAAKLVA
jgi:CHAD domain-containing protein